jgi:hypothetical protein
MNPGTHQRRRRRGRPAGRSPDGTSPLVVHPAWTFAIGRAIGDPLQSFTRQCARALLPPKAPGRGVSSVTRRRGHWGRRRAATCRRVRRSVRRRCLPPVAVRAGAWLSGTGRGETPSRACFFLDKGILLILGLSQLHQDDTIKLRPFRTSA